MSLESTGGFRSRSRRTHTNAAQPQTNTRGGSRSQDSRGQSRRDNTSDGENRRANGTSQRSQRQSDRGSQSHGNRSNRARGQQHTRSNHGSHTGYRPGQDPRLLLNVDIARAVSFDVIYRVDNESAYANLVLPAMLRQYNLKRRDSAFATEITYGCLRNQGVIDKVLGKCSSRPLADMDPGVRTTLRLGAYQLLYTRVDPYAAVDSSVRLVEAIGQEHVKGFVNGILRTISRKAPAQWMKELEPHGEIAAKAFRHSHPEWIANSFAKVVGLAELDDVLEADSLRPIVHLVAHPGEISQDELAAITGGDEGKYSPYAVYLPSGDPGQIDAIREGLAGVQDEGSQLIARAVVEAPLEGEDQGRWLDLCAGPGGKATLMGALARIDGAHVDAIEVQPHRAQLIQKAVKDLPVTVITADGRDPGLTAGYDRVLVDAPCSGLGALRRRPEARWRKQESDIAELSQLQRELLESALKLVRPGGVVVYSTCSPDLRETREVVEHALAKHADIVELDAAALVPGMEDTGEYASVQMWPHRHGTDAMFFTVLRRQA